jgi:hypothetical protein
MFRVKGNAQPRYPMGGNTLPESFRRLHEYRDGPYPTAHTDYQSLAYPVYGVSSKYGINLFRAAGRDAASRGIVDGSSEVPMARGERPALRS